MFQVQDFEGANNKRVRPQPIKAKQDWHERLRNLRLGKKGADSGKPDNSAMAYAIFDDNLYLMHERGFSQPNVSCQLFTLLIFLYCSNDCLLFIWFKIVKDILAVWILSHK